MQSAASEVGQGGEGGQIDGLTFETTYRPYLVVVVVMVVEGGCCGDGGGSC